VHLGARDTERVVAIDQTDPPFAKAVALGRLGRANEGIDVLRERPAAERLRRQLWRG